MPRALRIFLCCQQATHRHAVPAYSFWAEYFRQALAEAGHVCVESPDCDWAAGLLPVGPEDNHQWSERTWSHALQFLKREHSLRPIDLFLGYLFPQQLVPGAIEEVQDLGIPCVNFFCDNVREFRRVPRAYAPFDLHWVPEFKALEMYARAGLKYLHAPMACWVPPHVRTVPESESAPATFIGTRDLQRERLFAEAISLGLKPVLRGPGWGTTDSIPVSPPRRARDPLILVRRQFAYFRQHGLIALVRKHASWLRVERAPAFDFTSYSRPPTFGADYWPALRECQVCLGVNRYPSWRHPVDRPDTYSRLRDVEAPMAGACYLTEWTEGLDQLYDLGTEIEVYRDASELVGKAQALAQDGPRRHRLRAAGQRRALAEHSIARTLQRIADTLALRS